MKRAGQILITVITALLGISVSTALGYLFVSFLMELIPVLFSIFNEVIISVVTNIIKEQFGGSDNIYNIIDIVTTIINISGSVLGFIIFTINLLFSFFLNMIDVALLVAFIIATIKAWKAKSKKDLLFPAVLCIVYGALHFVNQNYIYAALGIAPGVMFLVLGDKDFKEKEPTKIEKIEEKKEEAAIEPEVVSQGA